MRTTAKASACITGSSCSGTSSEEKSSLTFQSGNSSTPTNGLTLSMTTGAGGGGGPTRTSALTYDEFSRRTSVDGPLSGSDDTTYTVFHAWDGTSAWVETIGPDPDGAGALLRPAVRQTFDIEGRLVRTDNATVTSTAGASFTTLSYSTVAYDSASRPIAATSYNAGGTALQLVNTSYNSAGLVECTAYRMNPSVFGTPTAACTATTTGSSGPDRITKTVYDDAGEAVTSYDAFGTAQQHVTFTTYTSSGQTATATDGLGNLTTYEYDAFDRLVKTRYPHPTSPGTSSTTDYTLTVYDATTGRVSETHLRDGRIVKPTYDAFGRVTEAWVGRDDSSFDAVDEFKLQSSYDQLGRVLTESTLTSSGGGGTTRTATMTYDALNLTSVATPLTVSGSQTTATVSYSYDAAGRRTQAVYPSSLTINYDWGVSSLNDIKEGSNQLVSFTYDQFGRRTALTRGVSGSPVMTTNYTYDDLSQLATLNFDLASTGNDVTRTFSLNQAGQVTQKSSTAGTYDMPAPSTGSTTYTVNGLNQMTAAGATSLTHDARGNTTAVGTDSYGYDLLNRMTSFGSKSLDYDPLGRLGKVVDGGTTTQFVYDSNDLIAEYDASGTLQRQYVHGPGEDEPLVWYEGSGTGTKKYMIADELGSITAVADSTGSLIAKRTYDEYGKPTDTNTPGRFGYTGQAYISEIGLYNYKARMYSPVLGRFMSPDPAGYEDGFNIYQYVHGDPMNLRDPLGLQTTVSPVGVQGNMPWQVSQDLSIYGCDGIQDNSDFDFENDTGSNYKAQVALQCSDHGDGSTNLGNPDSRYCHEYCYGTYVSSGASMPPLAPQRQLTNISKNSYNCINDAMREALTLFNSSPDVNKGEIDALIFQDAAGKYVVGPLVTNGDPNRSQLYTYGGMTAVGWIHDHLQFLVNPNVQASSCRVDRPCIPGDSDIMRQYTYGNSDPKVGIPANPNFTSYIFSKNFPTDSLEPHAFVGSDFKRERDSKGCKPF